MQVRLEDFDKTGFSRGRSKGVETLWYVTKRVFFLSSFPWPAKLKTQILRAFGSQIGIGLKIQPRVNIHFPWRLEIGDHCWIGQRCEILNFEFVRIGSNVALAHDIYIATGNHDYTDCKMPYMNAATTIGNGTWVATRAFIGPGVEIGEHCVIAAGSTVTRDIPAWSVARGNPASVVRERKLIK